MGGFEEFAKDDVQVTRLLVLELLEVPSENTEHRALHGFFNYVVIGLGVEFVFNSAKKFVDLGANILLSFHLLLGSVNTKLLLSFTLKCTGIRRYFALSLLELTGSVKDLVVLQSYWKAFVEELGTEPS